MIDISGDALRSVTEVLHGIVGFGSVDGIEVVKVLTLVVSVERHSVELLGGEDIAGYSFCDVAEGGGGVLHLCLVGGVEVVCECRVICTVEWDSLVRVGACRSRFRTILDGDGK